MNLIIIKYQDQYRKKMIDFNICFKYKKYQDIENSTT